MLEIKYDVFGSLENNCYLITDAASGESAIIDCTEDSPKMRAFVKSAKLKYILLTHGHFDHIAGVKAMKANTGAICVISAEDEPMLSSSKDSLAAFCNAPQNNTTAELIVSDGDSLMLGEIEIKVIATPGHTKGSVCYIADNNIFSGDTLFFCSCGRTDFPGGSGKQMLESLKRLSQLDGDYNVYAGHDRQSTLEYERKHNPYMNR